MSVNKLENLFGVSRNWTILILFSSIILFISMIIKIMTSEKQHWQIIQNGKYHLTTDPVITGECVDFTDDENGQSITICGSYKMKKI